MTAQKHPATAIQPYLFFGGRCEEALEFYQKTLGAKIEMMMRFSESPDAPPPGMLAAGFENKVMHASFVVRGTVLMASDGCNEADGGFHGFSLSLSLPDEAEVNRISKLLAEGGGAVEMPPGKTFFSPCFAMVRDKFGMGWMLIVPGEI